MEIEWECYEDFDIEESIRISNIYAVKQLMADHDYVLPDGQVVQVRHGRSFVGGIQVIILRDGTVLKS